ncbi:unnamed protein product [Urochloa decumbens]|uniref:DUF4220 domain-containing protein n=1 Tax=Urochloa decumbens TaxID=240449 RepID=A0ABC8VIX5_9POAL
MTRLEPVVVFWSGWGIHFMVLMSFTVQVVLLVLADIRRHKDWPVLKVIIWLAYMLADTTAIYALGHMSVICRSPEHHLMALWAPLLLVHLGGQDNITAYAIEDNRLWLRHFQNFGLQVLGTAYVLQVSSILSSPSVVLLATILMFVVGVLKYGERVWALMHADSSASSSLSATSYKDFKTDEHPDGAATTTSSDAEQPDGAATTTSSDAEQLDGASAAAATTSSNAEQLDGPSAAYDYEQCLRVAYSLLDVPKQMFEGPTRYVKMNDPKRYDGFFVLQMVELQLSMMYDLLYTKAAVVHTWYGLYSRVISLAFTVTALLLLLALSERDGYSRVDVAVTKFLLIGAVVLETMSVLRAVFSKWTAVLVFERKWNRLRCVAQIVEYLHTWRTKRRLRGEGYLLWSGRVEQHKFFLVLYHTNYSTSSKIAKKMGHEDWWDSFFYSWTTRVPRGIIEMVVYLVSTTERNQQIDITESRGLNAIRIRGHSGLASWIEGLQLELDESILVWHIASSAYIEWLVTKRYASDITGDIRVLSNYMFFLLAARPYMLPYPVSRQRYVQLCYDAVIHLRRWNAKTLLRAILGQKKRLLRGHPFIPYFDISSSKEDIRNTAAEPSTKNTSGQGTSPVSINRTLDIGCKLAAELIHHTPGEASYGTSLEMIFEVWVEMLCYTAYRCNENFHAKHLSDGGEFMTVVALLMIYMSSGLINKRERDAMVAPILDAPILETPQSDSSDNEGR